MRLLLHLPRAIVITNKHIYLMYLIEQNAVDNKFYQTRKKNKVTNNSDYR